MSTAVFCNQLEFIGMFDTIMQTLFIYCCILQDTTTDLAQNRNSVVIQLLVALFAFSSYYQENVLIELVNLYATRKLTEGEIRFISISFKVFISFKYIIFLYFII